MSVSTSYLMDPLLPWPPRAALEGGAPSEGLAGFSQEELDAFCLVKGDPAAMAQVMKMARKLEGGRR